MTNKKKNLNDLKILKITKALNRFHKYKTHEINRSALATLWLNAITITGVLGLFIWPSLWVVTIIITITGVVFDLFYTKFNNKLYNKYDQLMKNIK